MRLSWKNFCVAVALNEMYISNNEFDLTDYIFKAQRIRLPLVEFFTSSELKDTIEAKGIDSKNVVDYLMCLCAENHEQVKNVSNSYFNKLILDNFIMPTVLHMLQATK